MLLGNAVPSIGKLLSEAEYFPLQRTPDFRAFRFLVIKSLLAGNLYHARIRAWGALHGYMLPKAE